MQQACRRWLNKISLSWFLSAKPCTLFLSKQNITKLTFFSYREQLHLQRLIWSHMLDFLYLPSFRSCHHHCWFSILLYNASPTFCTSYKQKDCVFIGVNCNCKGAMPCTLCLWSHCGNSSIIIQSKGQVTMLAFHRNFHAQIQTHCWESISL